VCQIYLFVLNVQSFNSLQLGLGERLNFDLDHITGSKLVPDVLSATETLEYASFNGNAHLCGKSFSLVHAMRCQNDG